MQIIIEESTTQILKMKQYETEINSFDDWLNSCKVSRNMEIRQALTTECTSILEDAKTRSEAAEIIICSLEFLNLTKEQQLSISQVVNDNIALPQNEAVDIIVNAIGRAVDQQVESLGDNILNDGCIIM